MRRAVAAIVGLVSCSSELAAPSTSEDTGSSGTPAVSSSSTDTTTGTTTTTTSDASGSTTSEVPTCAGAWAEPPEVLASSWAAADPRLGIGLALSLAPDGDIVVTYASRYDPPSSNEDALVVRYDGAIEAEWIEEYTGSGLDDHPLGVAVDALGRPYALVRENLSEVHAESWTYVDSRLVVLAYDVDGTHRWRWELDSEPADPAWPDDARRGLLAIDDEGHPHLLATGDANQQIDELVLVELDGFGNVVRHTAQVGAAGSKLIGFALAKDGEARVLTDADVDYADGGKVYAIAHDGAIRELARLSGAGYRVKWLALGTDDELVVAGYAVPQQERFGFTHGFAADGTPTFVVQRGLPDRIGAVVVDCDGTSIIVGTRGARVDAVALDRDGQQAWSLEIPHGGGITSTEALGIAKTDDRIAVIGWSDLAADDPGTAPWLALLEPS